MARFTARIIAPDQLTADELRRALEAIGCHLEAQPMAGNRPAFCRPQRPPQTRYSTAPDLAPEGI